MFTAEKETRLNERTPIFNAPSVVLGALFVIVVVHVARLLLPEELDARVVLALAFIPARYDGYAAALPGGLVSAVTSFLSHALVHANAAHLLLNGAWLLAFGGAVAARVGAVRFLGFASFCAVAAATTFLCANWGLLAPMIGASGAVAGLMAASIRLLFSAIDQGGFALLRTNPRAVRLMGLAETFGDRRILAVTGIWIVINALAAIGLSVPEPGGAIAWEAHLGGYFAGLVTFGLFGPARLADVAAPDNLR